jgi:hypothetical protein
MAHLSAQVTNTNAKQNAQAYVCYLYTHTSTHQPSGQKRYMIWVSRISLSPLKKFGRFSTTYTVSENQSKVKLLVSVHMCVYGERKRVGER